MRRFRHLWISLFLICFSLLGFVGRVEATDGLRGDECIVTEDEIILQDFYFFCNTLVVYGYISGDIVGIASEVTIAREGHVTGDIWIVGGQLTIEGVVGDDIHFVGADLDVTGLARFSQQGSDIIAAGISLQIDERVVIPGDVIYYGYQAILEGAINGNIDFQGQSLLIQNNVAGSVNAIVGDQEGNAPLSSLPLLYSVDFRKPGLYFSTSSDDERQGYVNGDLTYEAPQRISTRDNIGGRVRYSQAVGQASITQAEQPDTFLQIVGNYILVTARDVTALGLIGVLMLKYVSPLLTEPGYRVQTKPFSAFSWGLILFLLSIPSALFVVLLSLLILLVIFVITISELTLMTAIILTVLNLGLMGGFLFLLIFMGRVITSFVVGYVLLRWIRQLWLRYIGSPPSILSELWLSVLLGVTVVALAVRLPLGSFVGLLQLFITGVVAIAGLGAIFMYLRDLRYITDRRDLPLSERMKPIPPPPEDFDFDLEIPVGMDNLPPGFAGFDE